jgi:hypothetical protein
MFRKRSRKYYESKKQKIMRETSIALEILHNKSNIGKKLTVDESLEIYKILTDVRHYIAFDCE